jgi:hypothetical protein
MLEISINKKHVQGRAEPGTLFFTDMERNAILLKVAYRSLNAPEVFKIMGVKRLTATMARRATATRIQPESGKNPSQLECHRIKIPR